MKITKSPFGRLKITGAKSPFRIPLFFQSIQRDIKTPEEVFGIKPNLVQSS